MNIRKFLSVLLLLSAIPFAQAEMGTLSADGDTAVVQAIVRPHVHVSGTFGSGTITFYFKDSNGGWRAISGAAFTTANDVTLDFERPVAIKGTLSGATAPSLVWVIN